MKNVLFVLVLASSGLVNAGELWTNDKGTNAALIAANAALVMDWAQTRYIADSDEFKEIGFAQKFIGDNPSTSDVNSYFVKSIVLTNAVGYFLPAKYKKWFYFGVISFEGRCIADNAALGIKMKF